MIDETPAVQPDESLPADAPWWARWIVAEWRQAWRWFSVQLLAFLAIAPELPELVPRLNDVVPASWMHHLQAFVAVVAIFRVLAVKSAATQKSIVQEMKP